MAIGAGTTTLEPARPLCPAHSRNASSGAGRAQERKVSRLGQHGSIKMGTIEPIAYCRGLWQFSSCGRNEVATARLGTIPPARCVRVERLLGLRRHPTGDAVMVGPSSGHRGAGCAGSDPELKYTEVVEPRDRAVPSDTVDRRRSEQWHHARPASGAVANG